jgi:ParB family transcriptional regulator, chromosome partitioning protein
MLTTKRFDYVPIDKIGMHPNVANHRELHSPKVEHLEKDILKNGLLEPLVVWERSVGEFFLVGGFHRMEAIRMIRRTHPGYFDRIDVRVVAGDPDEIKALNLKLNADRLDAKITDYFETVIYLNNANWSTERIADFLDKSTAWIEEIIKYGPMVTPTMRTLLNSGGLSWNRAKEIIQRTLKSPAGKEKAVLSAELAKSQGRISRPITFKSAISHFSRIVKTTPEKTVTLKINDLFSFVRLLQGKEYDDKDLKRVRLLFPELLE